MMHIAKGVTRSSAAPVSIPGGNSNINTDQATDKITIAEMITVSLLQVSVEFTFLFDNTG